MPLRDKTINPILEKACGLSSEPVLYPVTHVFVRCKTMCANIFLQLSKCVKIALGEMCAVGRMLNRFQPNLSIVVLMESLVPFQYTRT